MKKFVYYVEPNNDSGIFVSPIVRNLDEERKFWEKTKMNVFFTEPDLELYLKENKQRIITITEDDEELYEEAKRLTKKLKSDFPEYNMYLTTPNGIEFYENDLMQCLSCQKLP